MTTKASKYAAQEAYQQRAGWVKKTFKVKQEVLEPFLAACKTNNETGSKAITRMMITYTQDTDTMN